jgi:deoxyribodipyrimidine photo-lyase
LIKEKINIVWLKRDLRTQDHVPFYYAENKKLPYLIIFIFDNSIIIHPDISLRHLQFQYHSILQINKKLLSYNRKVETFYGNSVNIFQYITNQFDVQNVYSYQESGIAITYNRDKEIAKFLKTNNIVWEQYPQNGIIRGKKNRDGWDKQWFETMHQPIIQNEYSIQENIRFINIFLLPNILKDEWKNYSKNYQPAGEYYAWQYIKSFMDGRVINYSKHISKPLESRTSCGRLSPYLSWGNISIKQAYQFALLSKPRFAFPIQNFLTRLKWHCHFIQKFEQECSYETLCVNKGFESFKHTLNEGYILAWKNGKTGFPLVDACMRCLQKTGWINFRMRAMLVSFFCHHLFQDWRLGVYHLANLFLDYEPGIHYPQFQMQAGTTGINIIRIYNPIKQSQEKDPLGVFIKLWVPELQNVPVSFIHEPYLMTTIDQQLCKVTIGVDYPTPIIDLTITGKNAREKIWSHRKEDVVKIENNKILKKHTRRKKQDEIALLFNT